MVTTKAMPRYTEVFAKLAKHTRAFLQKAADKSPFSGAFGVIQPVLRDVVWYWRWVCGRRCFGGVGGFINGEEKSLMCKLHQKATLGLVNMRELYIDVEKTHPCVCKLH